MLCQGQSFQSQLSMLKDIVVKGIFAPISALKESTACTITGAEEVIIARHTY
jgi:hypothetical protein